MPIQVPCPSCQSKLNIPDAAQGKNVKCPKCSQTFKVPVQGGGQAPPPQQQPPQQIVPPPQQGGYAPPPQQGGYAPPPQQGGYAPPPQQGGYAPPPQQGGYAPPPQQGGYVPPPQQGGYAPPPQGGYPPQQGGYPPQQGGYDDYDEPPRRRRRRGGSDGEVTETRYRPEVFSNLYRFVIICLLVTLVAAALSNFLVFTGVSQMNKSRSSAESMIMFGTIVNWVLGIPANIAQVVLSCMLLYKMWNQLQDGETEVSPGKAVGFLFIPFFNLYWLFIAYRGLATEMNEYSRRHRIRMEPVSENIVTYWLVSTLLIFTICLIPIAAPASIVLYFMSMNALVKGAKSIASAKLRGAG